MHDSIPAAEILTPPPSVRAIVRFLAKLATHRGADPAEVGNAWQRERITQVDVQEFLKWMHVDRLARPVGPIKTKAPERDLHKPELEPRDDETGLGLLGRPPQTIDVHLWQTLLSPESRGRAYKKSATSPNRRSRAPGSSTVEGYFEAVFASPGAVQDRHSPAEVTRLVPVLIRETAGESEEGKTELAAGLPGTTGIRANAWSQKVLDGKAAAGPAWNEPLRRDVLPVFAAPGAPARVEQANPLQPVADPLYGQITLIAPPMTVAPGQRESTVGVKFDWKDIASSIGPIDESSFNTLATSLPKGAKALYPALDPRSLTRGAVNLKLAPSMIQNLIAMGFGDTRRVDAFASAKLASDYYGGTPPVRRLPARFVSADSSPRPTSPLQSRGLGEPSRRMRFLDYLGFPIYLSPTLSVRPDLDQQMYANVSTEYLPRAPLTSPLSFAGLSRRLFGGFAGIETRADAASLSSARAGLTDRPAPSPAQMPGAQTAPIVSPSPSRRQQARMPARTPLPPSPTTAPRAASLGLTPYDPRSLSPMRPISAAPLTAAIPPVRPGAPPTPTSLTKPMATAPAMTALGSFPSAIPAGTDIGQPTGPITEVPSARAPIVVRPQFSPATTRGARVPPQTKAAPQRPGVPAVPIANQLRPGPAIGPGHGIPIAAGRTNIQEAETKTTRAPARPPARVHSEWVGAPSSTIRPPLTLASPRPGMKSSEDAESLAIQTSTSQQAPTGGAKGGSERPSATTGRESGMPGSEINLLANEVWSLLKRRLAFEAQRSGHR